jgi:O-antigen biosynthesis protein WbqP
MRSIDKRALDLAIGVPAAIVAAPVVAALGLVVVLTSGWPPLIRQARVGADEHEIPVWKLRTMRRGTPIVAKSALLGQSAVRYTPIGPWMRRFSLDELPQVYSVVKGDMTLVGPRPALPSQHDLLELRRRHGVTHLKPGLTGLAQVEGRESLTLPTKVRFESHYLRHMSIGYDLGIIARTFRAVLSKKGAL